MSFSILPLCRDLSGLVLYDEIGTLFIASLCYNQVKLTKR